MLITHEHYDHVGGLDDLRPFCRFGAVPIYAEEYVARALRLRMPYCFVDHRYPGVPDIPLQEIEVGHAFSIHHTEVVPLRVMHGRLPILGYRIGRLAYLTDFKTIGDAEVEKLRGVEVLVVNALRFTEHYSHFNVAEARALIARVAPREAYLTHMSHDIGLHAVTEPTLPRGVHMAYDTLQLEIND